MAVAYMASACRKDHAFGRPGLVADHEIVAAEIEAFQSHGHEREQRAMPAPPGIQKRSNDAMTAYILADCARIAKKREDVCMWQQTAESIQDFFAAAAIQQPVMHECRAHVVYQLTAQGALEYPQPAIIYYRNWKPRDIQ